jgi:hypothetical protein
MKWRRSRHHDELACRIWLKAEMANYSAADRVETVGRATVNRIADAADGVDDVMDRVRLNPSGQFVVM